MLTVGSSHQDYTAVSALSQNPKMQSYIQPNIYKESQVARCEVFDKLLDDSLCVSFESLFFRYIGNG